MLENSTIFELYAMLEKFELYSYLLSKNSNVEIFFEKFEISYFEQKSSSKFLNSVIFNFLFFSKNFKFYIINKKNSTIFSFLAMFEKFEL